MNAHARVVPTSNRVLVVDADVHERRLLAHALERAGFTVVEAATGREALAQVEVRPFAAVLLADSPSDQSGADIVRRLREREDSQSMAVLLLQAADELGDRASELAPAPDVNATILRPLHAADLVAHVRAQLRASLVPEPTVEELLRDRADVAASLSVLDPKRTPEEAADTLCHELLRGDVEGVALVTFPGDGTAVALATAGAVPNPFQVRRPLPAALGVRLEERARMGPWTEPLVGDDRLRPWPPTASTSASVVAGRSLACAPLVAHHELLGLLVLCTWAESGSAASLHTLSAAIDFAAVAVDRLLPGLLERGHLARRRAHIEQVIEEHAFATVFQPIVDLTSHAVAGYEALTRFHDGSAPADRFAEASRIAMGTDLEAAALQAAFSAASRLPDDAWLSVNVSPALVLEGDRLEAAVAESERPIVLELTEHDPVDDYEELRRAVRRLGPQLQLSIDDAGSGFASLRHVLALDPAFVKLDRSWVHHVHLDPARQALLAGLVYFASRTGCRLIAEGVETEEDLDCLRTLEVELGQGYLLGRPARLNP